MKYRPLYFFSIGFIALSLIGAGCSTDTTVEGDVDANVNGQNGTAQEDSDVSAKTVANLRASLDDVETNVNALEENVTAQLDILLQSGEDMWEEAQQDLAEARAEAKAQLEAYANASAETKAELRVEAEQAIQEYKDLYAEVKNDLESETEVNLESEASGDVDAENQGSANTTIDLNANGSAGLNQK